MKVGFIAAFLGSNRPISEMLKLNLREQRLTFDAQFTGMASEPFSYKGFEVTRERLVTGIHRSLTTYDRAYCSAFRRCA